MCITYCQPAHKYALVLVQSYDPECRHHGAHDRNSNQKKLTGSPLCFLKLISSVFPVPGTVLGDVSIKIKRTQEQEGFPFLKVSFYKGHICVSSDCCGSPLLEVALFSCNF